MTSKQNVPRYTTTASSANVAAPSSSPKTSISNKSTTTVTVNKPGPLMQSTTAAQQHQKLQMQSIAAEQQIAGQKMQTNNNRSMDYNSMSGSDTDVSTSNENLSVEQRYVLRNTPRVEPQGQENLAEAAASGNESTGDFGFWSFFFLILALIHSSGRKKQSISSMKSHPFPCHKTQTLT